jgi:hypothetical protein
MKLHVLFTLPFLALGAAARADIPACLNHDKVINAAAVSIYEELAKTPLEAALISLSERILERYRAQDARLAELDHPEASALLIAYRQGGYALERTGLDAVLNCKLAQWMQVELEQASRLSRSPTDFMYGTAIWDFFIDRIDTFAVRTAKLSDAEALLEYQFAMTGLQALRVRILPNAPEKASANRASRAEMEAKFARALQSAVVASDALFRKRLNLPRFHEALILEALQ